MIKRNTSERTYDYFKVDPFVLNGKFARYADAMWEQNSITEKSRFVRLLDLYAIAAIIGLRIGNRLPDDKSLPDKRTIQLDQIAKEYTRFYTIMQVILIVDDSRGLDIKDKVHMAFDTNPKSERVYTENMELFNSYARGGIEYLYNKLVLRASDPDDEFTNVQISNMFEFIKNPVQRDILD